MKRVHYIDAGQWPVHIGFTNNEAAFNKEMKRLKVKNADFLASDHADASTVSLIGEKGSLCLIVTLGSCEGKTMAQVAGLIAHEATHVAQRLWEHIGEDNPGTESEAYFIQMVTQACLENFDLFNLDFNIMEGSENAF